jgi:hypothetical protein
MVTVPPMLPRENAPKLMFCNIETEIGLGGISWA